MGHSLSAFFNPPKTPHVLEDFRVRYKRDINRKGPGFSSSLPSKADRQVTSSIRIVNYTSDDGAGAGCYGDPRENHLWGVKDEMKSSFEG